MVLELALSYFKDLEQVGMRELGRELWTPELDVRIGFVCCDQFDRRFPWILAKNFCEEDGAVIGAADVLAQRVGPVYDLPFPLLALFKHNFGARSLGRFEHGICSLEVFGS